MLTASVDGPIQNFRAGNFRNSAARATTVSAGSDHDPKFLAAAPRPSKVAAVSLSLGNRVGRFVASVAKRRDLPIA